MQYFRANTFIGRTRQHTTLGSSCLVIQYHCKLFSKSMVCFPFHFQFFVCFQIMCVGMIVTSVDGGKETFCNMFRDLFIPFYHYHLSKLYCYAQFIFSQTKGESRILAENLVQRIRQLTTLLSQQYGLFFFYLRQVLRFFLLII